MSSRGVSGNRYERAAAESYSPAAEESEFVAYVDERLLRAKNASVAFRKQAWLGVALYANQPWSSYDDVRDVLVEDRREDWEIRLSLGYARNALDIIVPKLTANRPGWVPTPATAEEGDKDAARACAKLLEALFYDLDVAPKTDEVVKWAGVTGVGVVRVGWDAEGGGRVDGVADGRPTWESVSPFMWFVDPGCASRTLRDARFVLQRSLVHVDELRQRFPKAKYLEPDTSYSYDAYSGAALDAVLGKGQSANEVADDRVSVVEFWERPSERFPNGVYAVVAGGLILHLESELADGRFPFSVVRYNAVPGRLFGDGLMAVVRGSQEAINRALCTRLEVMELNANGKWAIEEGSIGPQSMTSEPGELVTYRRGSKPPIAIPPPPVSPEYEKTEVSQLSHLNALAGLTDISTGRFSPSISGRAMAMASDIEASRLQPVSTELEALFAETGGMLLSAWKRYAPESATLRVVGADSRVEVLAFEKSAVRSTDVRVLPGSMRVVHPSVKREMLTAGFQMGAYGSPQDPAAVSRYRRDMEWGSLEYLQGDNPDGEAEYAREENGILFGAAPEEYALVRAMPFEDHAVHKAAHRLLLSSVEFRKLDADRYAAALKHYAEHCAYEAKGENWYVQVVPELIERLGPPAAAAAGGAGGPGPGTASAVGAETESEAMMADGAVGVDGPSPRGPGVAMDEALSMQRDS